jgi:CRP/FNR family cyclic AMP-dependent transcriptional regulator
MEATAALERILADQPFFKGVPVEKLALIAECAHEVTFAAGDYLFQEGQPADHFYVVTRGHVALEIDVPGGGQRTIQTVGEDEVLGWSWLFPPYRWHFDGRAVGSVRAVAVDGTCLRGKCDDDPALGYELMRRFSQVMLERLQATRLRLADVYGVPQ